MSSSGPQYAAARRTLAGLVASCLAILPLRQIFTDWGWLVDAWIAMALTLLPAAALRLRYQPRIIHLLPGAVLVLGFLTARYVPDHAVGGVLPLAGAWSDVSSMAGQFSDAIRDETAPLASTAPIRMVLSTQLTLMAIAVDLLAVVARRPALAGVPFLLVYTLAGAVPRHAVSWVWFVLAAAGYLMLLAADSGDELARWGRVMPRTSGNRVRVQALSGRRIGVIAIAAAVCVPLIVPVHAGNVLADALHRSGGGGNGSDGNGAVTLDPFVALKGSLTLGKPVNLLEVQVNGNQSDPFYLRDDVLDTFDGKGWRASGDGQLQHLAGTTFAADPPGQHAGTTTSYTATVRVLHKLGGNVPIFASPTAVTGEIGSSGWSPRNALLVGHGLDAGQTYVEQVDAPDPTLGELTASAPTPDSPDLKQLLELPKNVPSLVRNLVGQLTANTTSPYRKARAISDYFTNPANGFVYSLQTKAGDSSDDLTNFLENKAGFCQQYAGAMAVMLRVAGVPSRVVIGYTHNAPDAAGRFTVTTRDAHAWVEAYFSGLGWVPFDPTPLSGTDAGRGVALPWAPHGAPSGTSGPGGNDAQHGGATKASGSASASNTPAPVVQASTPSAAGGPGWPLWLAIGLVLLVIAVLLIPATARWARRRARLSTAAPDPLWAELADTAVDLGYVWSPVRSPRQVASWLGGLGMPSEARDSLGTLATAVERARYAPPGEDATGATLVAQLRVVEGSLRARRSTWARIRARLLPNSLGWGLAGSRRRRH